jgi:hypothetical protein
VDGDATGDSSLADSAPPDASTDQSASSDGGATADGAPADIIAPDAGPVPPVPCGDAGADASVACPIPPSECIDDHTMRYYYGGTCNADAGVCEYLVGTMHCDPSSTPPDCYQGGCRIIVVR